MANTKISQLPEYTGSTLDGYMVFNNSGETTTYKYKLPVDLGGGSGGGSPFSPYGINSVKLSGETLPNSTSASTNTMFFGTNYSGNTIFGSPNGGADNSLSVGVGNNVNRVNGNVNYTYMFGVDNASRGGSHNVYFGNANNSNANGYGYWLGSGNNGENGNYQFGWGSSNQASNSYSLAFGESNFTYSTHSYVFGKLNSNTGGSSHRYIFGDTNTIQGTTTQSGIFAGNNNTISGRTNAVMIGTSGRTADTDYCTFVENLKIFNYSNLDFADDTAAAAGGVVLGQVYHTSGTLKVRIV